ncbi:hypothetical protein JKG68_07175 [Microvirga aerilata]|uniref:Uncharacterized protein n=1 Tax=Microvirga aerilata TaxID=670292 RepID=A0A937D153_9HYPH|nr:hypothetical protein [Microvirga aerilata]MBL0403740.1 hypothetical protein [Microvirga aerilata]
MTAEHVERGLKTLGQSWHPPEVIAQAIQEREGLLVVTMPASGPIESALARAGQDLDLVLDYNPWIVRAWQSISRMPRTVRQFWGTVAHWGCDVLKGLAGVVGPCGAARARAPGHGVSLRLPARQPSGPPRRSGQVAGTLHSPTPLRAVKPRRPRQAKPP